MVTVVPAWPDVGLKPPIWGVTVVVIRPIDEPAQLANHIAPSGPAVIPLGPASALTPLNVVSFPVVVIRPIELPV